MTVLTLHPLGRLPAPKDNTTRFWAEAASVGNPATPTAAPDDDSCGDPEDEDDALVVQHLHLDSEGPQPLLAQAHHDGATPASWEVRKGGVGSGEDNVVRGLGSGGSGGDPSVQRGPEWIIHATSHRYHDLRPVAGSKVPIGLSAGVREIVEVWRAQAVVHTMAVGTRKDLVVVSVAYVWAESIGTDVTELSSLHNLLSVTVGLTFLGLRFAEGDHRIYHRMELGS